MMPFDSVRAEEVPREQDDEVRRRKREYRAKDLTHAARFRDTGQPLRPRDCRFRMNPAASASRSTAALDARSIGRHLTTRSL